MDWVGLTGGIASGKSTVANLFRKEGIPVVDADELARAALSPGTDCYQKVVSHFGTAALDADGVLDRRKLGDLVFSNPDELRFLESQIHPFVQEQAVAARGRFRNEGHLFAVYDVPLLFEKKLESQFDRILVVGCSQNTQIERLKTRSHLTEEQARLRLQNQLDLEFKMAHATDLIWNEGSLPDLELQVKNLIQKYRGRPS